MKTALLIDSDEGRLVSASDVLNNFDNPHSLEFCDPEYQFRVCFVKDSKGHGGPYFRLLYGISDFSEKFPDKANLYGAVSELHHMSDDEWVKNHKERVKNIFETDKFIKNGIGLYRFADICIKNPDIVMELRKSFTDYDFEDRNRFFESLGYKAIWLYDLSWYEVKPNFEGEFEITDFPDGGFLKISENKVNLLSNYVFIEAKDGNIYRITNLYRKVIDDKNSVTAFRTEEVYTWNEFIETIKKDKLQGTYRKLSELLDVGYKSITVHKANDDKNIFRKIEIDCDGNFVMDENTGLIKFMYCIDKGEYSFFGGDRSHLISISDENSDIWLLIKAEKKIDV